MSSSASRRRPLFALLAVLLAAGPAAAAGNAGAGGDANAGTDAASCPARYAASLKTIREREWEALRAALSERRKANAPAATPVSGPAASDGAVLPGTLIFVSQPRPRSQAEIAALTAAVALARSRGRSAAVVGNDADWIAARISEDLGDYLGQKPTPFLCNGVPDYLKTLRSYAARLGPTQGRMADWTATQRAATKRSVDAALAAVAAAAKAKAPQPAGPPMPDALRPAADLSRVETSAASAAVPLGTPEDLLAVIDRLTKEARAAGLVAEPADMPVITGAIAAAPRPAAVQPAVATGRPVLKALGVNKPLVMSGKPLIRDRTVRLKMLAAFADIEMLDYLVETGELPADPVAAGIDGVLQAIEAAQGADCTCAAAR